MFSQVALEEVEVVQAALEEDVSRPQMNRMDTDGSRRVPNIALVLSEAQPNGARNRNRFGC
jgi:hypothetical protein